MRVYLDEEGEVKLETDDGMPMDAYLGSSASSFIKSALEAESSYNKPQLVDRDKSFGWVVRGISATVPINDEGEKALLANLMLPFISVAPFIECCQDNVAFTLATPEDFRTWAFPASDFAAIIPEEASTCTFNPITLCYDIGVVIGTELVAIHVPKELFDSANGVDNADGEE